MDPLSIIAATGSVVTIDNVFWMIVGLAIGVVVGATPGLVGPTGMVLALPFTLFMDPVTALLFLLSIYFGGLYGGAITAILFNTPGSPAAIATAFDGYPLARKGRGSYAIGLAVGASTLGGMFGLILLVLFISQLAEIAIKFASAELFVLTCIGVLAIASLSRGSFLLGLFTGVAGLMLGTIGIHISGASRGTFGFWQLSDGIPLVPALMGFFAIAEMFDLMLFGDLAVLTAVKVKISIVETLRGVWHSFVKYPITMVRSSLIGLVVGVAPGAGAPVAVILSYDQAKRFSRERESFGEGAPDGVVAAESADNATEGGSLATALLLGLPGSVGTAVFLAAITSHGYIIGPRLVNDHPDVFAKVLAGSLVSEMLLLPVGIICAYPFVIAQTLSTRVIAPAIIVFAVLGGYLTTNSMFTAQLVLAVGGIAWLLRAAGLPLIPMVIGLILGPIFDANYTRLTQGYSEGAWAVFTRPLSTALVVVLVLIALIPLWREIQGRRASRSRSVDGGSAA